MRLLLGGFHPPYFAGLQGIEYIPPVDYTTYSQIIRGCDIVLAPLDPTDEFNNHKSPIKAVEGMGASRYLDGREAGAAVIATKGTVYSPAIQDGKTGLLIEQTEETWYNAIELLIK